MISQSNGYIKLILGILASATLGAYAWATFWPIMIIDKSETAITKRIDRLEDKIDERFKELYTILRQK